jgi:Ca2+/H+ antiporter, TMEM165/GDT1 family
LNVIVSSFLLVAAAEMGDKTQLLAFTLASRFRRPWTVMAGILVATLLNHAGAAAVGSWASAQISPHVLEWILAALFLAFAIWMLIPDQAEAKQEPRYGPFLTTAVLFFLAEMGDKTQLATVALGARYQATVLVTLGTTLGMLVADGLAVFLGDRLATRVQARWVRWVGAALFLAFAAASAWKALSTG